MKKYARLLLLGFCFMITSPVLSSNQTETPTTVPDKTGMSSDVITLAKKMGIGWNLGNSLEACKGNIAGETLWKNPVTTKALIDSVKAAGFNTVRIPCAWSGYIEDEHTYGIKPSWLARVKEVVDYCIDNDMYVIINIHWDGGWLEENPTYDKQDAVNKKQKALWEQIAIYFRDYDEHLLFAGTNEVRLGYDTPAIENVTVQMSYNQTFVDAVRATGGKNTWRNLLVQTYNTNIDHGVDFMKMPVDPTPDRMMVEVHYYDPYEFCLNVDNTVFLWGKNFTGKGTIRRGQEDFVDKQFGRMKSAFVDKGIPVVLGEYGVILRSSLKRKDYIRHIEARNYYLNYVTKAAIAHGMVPIYWDNGGTGNKAFGLFNRATGEQIHRDAITAIISAGEIE
ncbi:glycoside hydrolase family 5 protein [Dysgonomonas macrotermitis]|uniref:Endoglucanase n=1 Tax=Dysgonomonas macrotermitis TaxID=1346286 RepID=A0A1M4VT23_9BACT|nr:glycoside hydrolase family 5 protein [Dysgonomonas macrotermitis]SHE72015.1 endoglucanase [Dysgonomonas macrotermitis]